MSTTALHSSENRIIITSAWIEVRLKFQLTYHCSDILRFELITINNCPDWIQALIWFVTIMGRSPDEELCSWPSRPTLTPPTASSLLNFFAPTNAVQPLLPLFHQSSFSKVLPTLIRWIVSW